MALKNVPIKGGKKPAPAGHNPGSGLPGPRPPRVLQRPDRPTPPSMEPRNPAPERGKGARPQVRNR